MRANAAIGATLWDSSCIGHEIATNFIQVNYTCRSVPSETTPDDMTTKATGSRVDQSQTHSFATGIQVPVPRDTKTIGMTTVHAVINKPMEQPVESMLGTRDSNDLIGDVDNKAGHVAGDSNDLIGWTCSRRQQ
ncbi:hypothetical protein LSAT2_011790 [Lamellibrachia satsuma]|nr:hypothetical protein LSAT2_011790 [Lamellibrachia satsuma]